MSQTNAQLLADSLGTASTGTVPIGGIILWSGSTGSVPDGWALCNGSNGTPNLQDKFVVGAGSGYAVGAAGGSADAVVVSHTHPAGTLSGANKSFINSTKVFQYGGDAVGAHGYTNSATSISGSTGAATNGVDGTNANLPPYYALAYIMRTS